VIEVRVARYLLVSSTLRKIEVRELLVETMVKLESRGAKQGIGFLEG
jgi:hypothetical protein